MVYLKITATDVQKSLARTRTRTRRQNQSANSHRHDTDRVILNKQAIFKLNANEPEHTPSQVQVHPLSQDLQEIPLCLMARYYRARQHH